MSKPIDDSLRGKNQVRGDQIFDERVPLFESGSQHSAGRSEHGTPYGKDCCGLQELSSSGGLHAATIAHMRSLLLLAMALAFAADTGYEQEIAKWRADREARLKADDGW